MLNRKGTDKPIEIFIALFIILAIAMLMLRMFADQLRQKTEELKRQEYKQALEQAKNEAEQSCSKACTKTLENHCSPKALAEYCIARVEGGLDLNIDNDHEDYVKPTSSTGFLLSGGACEDTVYCREIKPCNECEKNLNLENCVKLTCGWLKNEGHDAATAFQLADQYYSFGDCLNDPVERQNKIDAKETWDWKMYYLLKCHCEDDPAYCACLSDTSRCPTT